jgi:luciferase family oxidoreductase group 1
MHHDGVEMSVGGRRQPLRATPRSASLPTVWLLGSSDYSARLAASRGLPYVFAHHFAGQGTAEAIELYRSSYQPSEEHPEPRTFLTVNAAVAATAEEARRLALPQVQQMVALRTGAPLTAQRLVEEAEATPVAEAHQGMVEAMLRRWVVDEPTAARRRVEELATEFGVDEVMVHPVASAFAGTDAACSPAREETLRLLAG